MRAAGKYIFTFEVILNTRKNCVFIILAFINSFDRINSRFVNKIGGLMLEYKNSFGINLNHLTV